LRRRGFITTHLGSNNADDERSQAGPGEDDDHQRHAAKTTNGTSHNSTKQERKLLELNLGVAAGFPPGVLRRGRRRRSGGSRSEGGRRKLGREGSCQEKGRKRKFRARRNFRLAKVSDRCCWESQPSCIHISLIIKLKFVLFGVHNCLS
jgi:hypothetical protein